MSLQRHLHGVLMAGMALVPASAAHAADPFTLTSTTFKDGQMMPRKVAASTANLKSPNCAGENLSPQLYKHLAKLGGLLAAGLADAARAANVPLQINAFGSLVTPFFTDQPVRDFRGAMTSDTARYGRFFQAMLARGIYIPPAQFEAWFLSAAHTERMIARLREAPVDEQHLAVIAEQNVRRLDIAVNDAAMVCVVDRVTDLQEVTQQAIQRVVVRVALALLALVQDHLE